MGLYRRKRSSYWYMSFTIDGKPYDKSTGTTDEKTAKEIWRLLEAKLALGQWHPEILEQHKERKEFTFSDLAKKYQDYKKPRLKSQKAIDNEASTIKMLRKAFGETELNQITTQALEQLQSDMLKAGNLPGTVNRKFDVLKNMFTKAGDWDMISEEALKRVRKCKRLKMENKRLRYLSRDECNDLVNACDTHLKPVVIMALCTGMRRGEILNLEWDKHVDLKHGFLLLTEDLTKNGTRREIPIDDVLRATLQGITRQLDVPYVFYDPATGKPYSDVKKSFRSACRRAKIRDFRFHDLRHTFASQMVMSGADIMSVSKLLGHKSLTMTNRYAHLAPNHLRKEIEKLDIFPAPKTAASGQKKEAVYGLSTDQTGNQPLVGNATA